MTARRFADYWRYQVPFMDHMADILTTTTRLPVIGWTDPTVSVANADDDMGRNTDFLVAYLDNSARVACRVRSFGYRSRYGDQFTIRSRLPTGVPTELDKVRDGFGDFGLYGFAESAKRGCHRLGQWFVYNLGLLREYLDDGGRWYERGPTDTGSYLAAFDVTEVASAKLGFLLNSAGLRLDYWPPPKGDCRVCGHPTWMKDQAGPVHRCCAGVPTGHRCMACLASDGLQHTRWGWPK